MHVIFKLKQREQCIYMMHDCYLTDGFVIILAPNKHVTLGECTNVTKFPTLYGSTKLLLLIIK